MKWYDNPHIWDEWDDLNTTQQNELCAKYQRSIDADMKYQNYTVDEIKKQKSLSLKSIKDGWLNLSDTEKNQLNSLNKGYTKHYHQEQREQYAAMRVLEKKRLKRNEQARERYEKKRIKDIKIMYEYAGYHDIELFEHRMVYGSSNRRVHAVIPAWLRQALKDGTATPNGYGLTYNVK